MQEELYAQNVDGTPHQGCNPLPQEILEELENKPEWKKAQEKNKKWLDYLKEKELRNKDKKEEKIIKVKKGFLIIDRRLRTHSLEWFYMFSHKDNFVCNLIINDIDRSSDFNETEDLKKLKEIDPDVGSEFMRVHLFIKEGPINQPLEEEVNIFADRMTHNLNFFSWSFVHRVKDPFLEVENYLKNWGITPEMYDLVDNPAFNHLSQDWQ